MKSIQDDIARPTSPARIWGSAPLTDGISRRAFLFTPVALAGLVALFYRKERRLPDATKEGAGSEVALVIFADNGDRKATVHLKKLTKSDAEWQAQLSPQEFAVTRRAGTEPPFTGRYWDNHETGLYRCVCCGTALFRSDEKFESGTGWPSFWAPIAEENVRTKSDNSLLLETRTEVLCKKCDAHLGHVFDDGPPPTNLRYCMNSAALRFVKRG